MSGGKYQNDSILGEIAGEIIATYHPHLREAQVAYLFHRESWKSKGAVISGKAQVVPEQWRFLSGYELLVMINETVWQGLSEMGRRVLLDYELSHFAPPVAGKNGDKRWSLRDHDLQEFSEVVRRYGICIGDPRLLKNTASQMELHSLAELSQRTEPLVEMGLGDPDKSSGVELDGWE